MSVCLTNTTSVTGCGCLFGAMFCEFNFIFCEFNFIFCEFIFIFSWFIFIFGINFDTSNGLWYLSLAHTRVLSEVKSFWQAVFNPMNIKPINFLPFTNKRSYNIFPVDHHIRNSAILTTQQPKCAQKTLLIIYTPFSSKVLVGKYIFPLDVWEFIIWTYLYVHGCADSGQIWHIYASMVAAETLHNIRPWKHCTRCKYTFVVFKGLM